MLPIIDIPLEATTVSSLNTFQQGVQAIALDGNWMKNLEAKWRKHSTSPAYEEIRKKLVLMCPGRKRCCYCEDSEAEAIDHIAPKAKFPQLTFSWTNYLYACAICNKRKGDSWAVFEGDNRELTKIPKHKSGEARIFTSNTDHVFISPRMDDPTNFLQLNLDLRHNKLDFNPMIPGLSEHDQKRGEYTLKVLKINSEHRPHLARSRRDAYDDYFAHLTNYAKRKLEDQWSENQLANIIERYKKRPHPSVWFEIKRCYQDGRLHRIHPEFHDLIRQVPESLDW